MAKRASLTNISPWRGSHIHTLEVEQEEGHIQIVIAKMKVHLEHQFD